MVRKIAERVSPEALQEDLKKYRRKAIELGANDAKIITTDMVLIDERVLAKCLNPKCDFYGTNANCPPYSMPPELTRKIVNGFHYAIFVWFKVSPEGITGHAEKDVKERLRVKLQHQETISRIESEAFYDGYYLALGFADGNCKFVFCPNVECSALKTGQGCRHHLKARSSMEAVGMDVFAMAARVGWDVYPIGRRSTASDIPHGSLFGLVLIH